MNKIIPILILTLLTARLSAQKGLHGTYYTPWGAELILTQEKTFDYKSFECYHLVSAKGLWTITDDTLRLNTYPKAGYDSIVSIGHTKIELNSFRITLTDKDSNISFLTPITAYTNGKAIKMNTDTLGYVDLNTQTVDSIQIGNQKPIKVKTDKVNQNHIIITFYNINFMDTERFDNRPFLIRKKKLHFIYSGNYSKKNYFKK